MALLQRLVKVNSFFRFDNSRSKDLHIAFFTENRGLTALSEWSNPSENQISPLPNNPDGARNRKHGKGWMVGFPAQTNPFSAASFYCTLYRNFEQLHAGNLRDEYNRPTVTCRIQNAILAVKMNDSAIWIIQIPVPHVMVVPAQTKSPIPSILHFLWRLGSL